MFHKNFNFYHHSTPVKSEPIKFPEDTTCNLTMKVNIGDSPKLFIMYYGRFYLMHRYVSERTGLVLLREILYSANLVFDEAG